MVAAQTASGPPNPDPKLHGGVAQIIDLFTQLGMFRKLMQAVVYEDMSMW